VHGSSPLPRTQQGFIELSKIGCEEKKRMRYQRRSNVRRIARKVRKGVALISRNG
jgi:hypothetical protein